MPVCFHSIGFRRFFYLDIKEAAEEKVNALGFISNIADEVLYHGTNRNSPVPYFIHDGTGSIIDSFI